MSDSPKKDRDQGSEFSLEQLLAIFGTVDPKILSYRDYCTDLEKDHVA